MQAAGSCGARYGDGSEADDWLGEGLRLVEDGNRAAVTGIAGRGWLMRVYDGGELRGWKNGRWRGWWLLWGLE